MIAGVHTFPRQQSVVYGRPAAEVVRETAESLGARRLFDERQRLRLDRLRTSAD